uniref:Uncharacterized protein n=1 Tax=Romanomermis culicivorax TaxID=13658 RepID=A0A915IGZ8_ROMCU
MKSVIKYFAGNLLSVNVNTICLMSKNNMVDEFNLGMLELLGIEMENIYASDKCQALKLKKNKQVRQKSKKASHTGGLEDCLIIGLES